MPKKIILGIVGTIIILAVAFTLNKKVVKEPMVATNQTMEQKQDNTMQDTAVKTENKLTMSDQNIPKDSMQQKDTMQKEPKTMDQTSGMAEKTPGMYKDYSTSALTEATKNGGKAVLFFHAKWCPFCKTADQAFSSKTSEIPSGVTVLKTDYDIEKDLRTKYGVTYQHTFVQIDANGNQITKWNGGDLETLKSNIK